MKKIISIMGLGLTLLFTGSALAETKIAIIDVNSIVQQMPEREKVGKALDAEFQARGKTLQEQEKRANDAAQQLQKNGLTLSASEKSKLAKVIQTFQENANQFSTDYRKRENEEANKLFTKIQDTVNVIAKEQKYDLILNANAAVYAIDSVDITNQVLQQVKK